MNSDVSAGVSYSASVCSRRQGMPSGPAAFLGFIFLSNFRTPFTAHDVDVRHGGVRAFAKGGQIDEVRFSCEHRAELLIENNLFSVHFR